jgi:hypothetical protein
VKRLFHSAILWRLAAVAVIFVIADFAGTPPVLGSGPTLAVTTFQNSAGAPASTLNAMNSALYQSVDQSGKFTAVGGGALSVQPAVDGSELGPSIDAASKANANEVVIGELISASGGSVVYRLSAYRVAPLAFIRSQVFSQTSLANASLAAGFVTNLNTLEAPREAIGTIYAVDGGVHADLGSVYGFQMGQQFNVMRNGQKMAQAQITGIEEDSATVNITNASNGYTPQVGDVLIGLQPLPALNPPMRGEPNTFSIIGIVAATAAALLAIGHHGQAAAANTGPAPTPTPISGFTVSCGTQTGQGTPNQSFEFTFSQPVDTASITFSSPSQIYYTTSVSMSQEPLTALGGTQTFDGTDTILTVTGTDLVPGQMITFFFTDGVLDQASVALSPSSCVYTQSVRRKPATATHVPLAPQPHHSTQLM